MKPTEFKYSAIDNNGVKQTLTINEWIAHPDTRQFIYATGELRTPTRDWMQRQQELGFERGMTAREKVGLDVAKDWGAYQRAEEKRLYKEKKARQEKIQQACSVFFRSRLV